MSHHPYKNLPETQFWSSGVKAPVKTNSNLAILPLVDSLKINDAIVSGGSCFAQYIGEQLTTRGYNYLRSNLSGERTESFGLGNIYTITQLKQWLEFSLGYKTWADSSVYSVDKQWYDLLLPHRGAFPSQSNLQEHRNAIKDEMLNYLEAANVFIFTVGLTETWKNSEGDIYPMCPGTLVGVYEKEKHIFHNCTFDEIHSDLIAVENYLSEINPELKLVYTVSPVPLTATASESHVLLATSYSKSVIRAAVGQYCNASARASYFPSFELISHQAATDWRFESNLRSISESGVGYVMGHAFADKPNKAISKANVNVLQPRESQQTAACEEELLDSYSKLSTSYSGETDIVIVGDCHMGKLGSGFKTAGINTIGGIVMHGSSFTDNKFELSEERIFIPQDSQESVALWEDTYDRMASLNGRCNILTNIGFQTHRIINMISNQLGISVLTENDIANYFAEHYVQQVHILSELTKYGQVWLVEDPDFYAFISDSDMSLIIRDKNFHQYCNFIRKIAMEMGINYLNPCDTTLQNLFKDSVALADIIHPEGFLGSQTYYEYCALVINESMGYGANTVAQAA